jgi:hypothetical protein
MLPVAVARLELVVLRLVKRVAMFPVAVERLVKRVEMLEVLVTICPERDAISLVFMASCQERDAISLVFCTICHERVFTIPVSVPMVAFIPTIEPFMPATVPERASCARRFVK